MVIMDENNTPNTPSKPVITPTPQTTTPTTPTTSPEPATTPTPQPTTSNLGPAPIPAEAKPKRSKKPLFVGLVVLVILGGVIGYVFGFYLPNRPQAVWRTGLDRTGDTLEKLINETTDAENLQKLEKSKVTGNFSFEGGDTTASGNIESAFEIGKSNSSFGLDIETGNASTGDVTKFDLDAEIISSLTEGKRFPDTYLKLTGFKDLGFADLFIPGISEYDGRWIALGSDFLESQLGQYYDEAELSDDASGINDITARDTADLSRAVTQTLEEHVFNSDETKGIIKQREFVAKEQLDDINTYHYKAGVNADNLKPFCIAMIENIFSVEAVNKFFSSDKEAANKAKQSAIDSCNEDMSEEARTEINDYTFDVWVDAKYKLIHKLRFVDEEQTGFVDVGQRYTGGDDVIFFVRAEFEDTKGWMEATSNFKTLQTKFEVGVDSKNNDEPMEFRMTMSIEPYSEEINVDRPEDSVNIESILGDLQPEMLTN